MGKTLAYKILENHLLAGELVPGEEIDNQNRPDFNTGLNRYYGIPAA